MGTAAAVPTKHAAGSFHICESSCWRGQTPFSHFLYAAASANLFNALSLHPQQPFPYQNCVVSWGHCTITVQPQKMCKDWLYHLIWYKGGFMFCLSAIALGLHQRIYLCDCTTFCTWLPKLYFFLNICVHYFFSVYFNIFLSCMLFIS